MKAYFSRLNIFFSERYPLLTGFLSSLMGVLGMYLIWCRINQVEMRLLSVEVVVAILSMFLLTLILRLCDEIKDKEADKILFPERCLPSGKVFYSDIQRLLYFLLTLFVIGNFIFGGSKVLLISLVIYIFLFYHYFFFPKIISKNLLLALITHNPLLWVAMLYTISIFAGGSSEFSKEDILLSLAFWMSSIGWETARKIRAPKDETDYETYSVALGPRLASLLPTLAFSLQAFIFVRLTGEYDKAFILHLILGVLIVAYDLCFVAFMLSLKSALAKKLQLITEIYLLFSSLILVGISLDELL